MENKQSVDNCLLNTELLLLSTDSSLSVRFYGHSVQCEPKIHPMQKLWYLRNVWIFLYQILFIWLVHNYAKVRWFLLYLR